ncbi:MAG: 50S ribosomal protein L18 [Bacilli bacterium]
MIKNVTRNENRLARHARIRKNMSGTSTTPRLNVFKSNTNIYASIIDDETKNTLVSASSLEMKLKTNNVESAAKVGAEIASRAKALKIKKVVFDRGGYHFHGKVKALAEAARENGLEF